jgi:putative DNA primase/helicase
LYLRMLNMLAKEHTMQVEEWPNVDGADLRTLAQVVSSVSQAHLSFRFVADASRWAWWTGSSWNMGGQELVVLGRFAYWLVDQADQLDDSLDDPEAQKAVKDLRKRIRSVNAAMNRTGDKSDTNPKYTALIAEKQVLQTILDGTLSANTKDANITTLTAAYRAYAGDIKQTAKLLAQLAGLPSMQVLSDDFNRHVHTIAAKNAVIDMRTGLPRNPSPTDLGTKTAMVNYVPGADCPHWRAFLESVIPNPDERECLRRCLGYSITGEVKLRRTFVMTGPTGSGKSTILNMITDILADYAVAEIPLSVVTVQRMQGHPTDLATLEGVRLGIVPEVSMERSLSTARIKLLTGDGDKITARRMREDFYTFTPRVKMWFTGNEPPNIREQGKAVLDRFVVFPLRYSFAPGMPGHDPNLRLRLETEKAGIFLWLLEGARRWYADGADVSALRIPMSLQMEKDDYMRSADDMGEFYTEWLYVLPETTASEEEEWHASSDVYRVYCAWAEQEGVRHNFSKRYVTQMMLSRGAVKRKTAKGIELMVKFLKPAQEAVYEYQVRGSLQGPLDNSTPSE